MKLIPWISWWKRKKQKKNGKEMQPRPHLSRRGRLEMVLKGGEAQGQLSRLVEKGLLRPSNAHTGGGLYAFVFVFVFILLRLLFGGTVRR